MELVSSYHSADSGPRDCNQPSQFVQLGFVLPAPSNRVINQIIVMPMVITAKTKLHAAAMRSSGGSLSGQARSARKRTRFLQNGNTEDHTAAWYRITRTTVTKRISFAIKSGVEKIAQSPSNLSTNSTQKPFHHAMRRTIYNVDPYESRLQQENTAPIKPSPRAGGKKKRIMATRIYPGLRLLPLSLYHHIG